MTLNLETFEKDFPHLDQFHNHCWIKGSGITDYGEIQKEIDRIRTELDGLPHQTVFARILEFIFKNSAIEINPHDPFGVNIAAWVPNRAVKHFRAMGSVVGEWQQELYIPEDGARFRKKRLALHEAGALWSYPDTDHSKPNWEDILKLGIRGLKERLIYHKNLHTEKGTLDTEKALFYDSSILTYEAFEELLGRFASAAKAMENASDKMPELCRALSNIAAFPPSDLYEVMLLTFIYHLIQEYVTAIQTRTLGNVDTLWRGYYEAELDSGKMTRDEIKTLVKYFYLRFEYEYHPNQQPLHLGGTDRNGKSLVNDLSYVMLEAYEELNIISPKLQLAISKATPDEFIKKGCAMLRGGHTSIVFANEDLGRKSMEHLTDNADDAAELSLSGCYNFSLKENVQPESAGTNFVKPIELALNDGTDPTSGLEIGPRTGNADSFADFDSFFDAYMIQMKYLIDCCREVSDFFDRNMLYMSPSPLYSANFEHNVSLGKDVYFDGSKYRNSVITVSCIASAADSLYAIKKYVYGLKMLTLPELRDILAANWKGHEDLRLLISRDKEKYGNNIDAVDSIAVRIMHECAEYIMSKTNPFGQKYAPDGEGITHGIAFGKRTGATPDGRLAGDQLSKNLQSVFGKDISGVTEYINSVTKIDATEYPNGAPIDFVLHPTAVKGDNGLDVMVALVRSTFQKGGSAIQGNIYDAEMLRDAQRHPEKYKGLQVRLCGWSQYFAKLTKDEQDMMIRQAETAS